MSLTRQRRWSAATCALLAVTLVAAGCAARRPANQPPPTTASAPAPPPACTAHRADAIQAEPDGAELALELATTVLVVGALATGIILGARSGGVALPPLQLDSLVGSCTAEHDALLCPDGDEDCAVAASAPAPG